MDIFSKYLILYEKDDLTPGLTVVPFKNKSMNPYSVKVRKIFSN